MKEVRVKTTKENEDVLISCAIDGLYLNEELFSHFRGSSNIGYLKIKKEDLILSAQNLHLGNANVNFRFNHGIISPAYKVFELVKVNPKFMQAWLKRDSTNKYFLRATTEGASQCRKNIDWDELLSQEFLLPSETEQKKIGDFVWTLDNSITLHQRKLNKHRNLDFFALKMFVIYEHFLLAGNYLIIYRSSVKICLVWEQRKLCQISERVKGNDGRMDLPTLTISAGNGWMRQEDRFSANIAGNEQKNYTLLKKGELSYNHGNSKLAKYGAVFELKGYPEALVPRVYHSFRITEGSPTFVDYLFKTGIPDNELRKLISSGARMDGLLNIGYEEFSKIKIIIPSTNEQDRIADFFTILDESITLHQRYRAPPSPFRIQHSVFVLYSQTRSLERVLFTNLISY